MNNTTSQLPVNPSRRARRQAKIANGGGTAACAWLVLVATGVLNQEINSPSGTFYWKQKYAKTTHFSMSVTNQDLLWGRKGLSSVELSKIGDAVSWMYLKLDLPGIMPDLEAAAQLPDPIDPKTQRLREEVSAATSQALNMQAAANQSNGGGGSDNLHQTLFTKKAAYGQMNTAGKAANPTTIHDSQSAFAYYDNNQKIVETKHFAYWTNAVGQAAIKSVTLSIGSMPIDKLEGEFLFIWDELTETRATLEMVGKRYSTAELIEDSRQFRTLYVPLPFFFHNNPGSSLAIASLAYNNVKCNFNLASINELIVKSHDHLPVILADPGDTGTPGDKIHVDHVDCSLMTGIVHLDQSERDIFQKQKHSTLIVQHQSLCHAVSAGAITATIPLTFQHPVSEIFWVLRSRANEEDHKHFDFSSDIGDDPLHHAKITMNNMETVSQSGDYFRTVQPYQHHSNVPISNVYCWSFALNPESTDPSGSCNFSRIDSIQLQLTFKTSAFHGDFDVLVYGRNANKLMYENNTGSLMYLTTA
jgi:hypothetical protein